MYCFPTAVMIPSMRLIFAFICMYTALLLVLNFLQNTETQSLAERGML